MATTNVFYMPASKPFWSPMAKDLASHGLIPAIWMGDWRHDNFGRTEFPDAEVLPIKETHTTISDVPLAHAPSAELLTSRAFLAMKNQAMKLMDRQDETRYFGRLERDAHFYSIFNHLYSSIIEKKIGALVVGEAPHHTAQLIGYRTCEMLGIPTYHLMMNTYVPLLQVQRQIVGNPLPVPSAPDVTKHIDEIHKSFETYREGIPTPLYMTNQANFDKTWKFSRWVRRYWRNIVALRVKKIIGREIRPSNDTGIRNLYPFQVNRRHWLTPFRVEAIRRNLEQEYPKFAEKVDFSDGSLPKFVYFPMPFEPERTTLPDGGDFYEAMDALLALRAYLPEDVHIFVKEHPSQFARKLSGYKGRSQLIYQVIANLPNTRLIDLSVPSASLTENAEFVCVITGTAALEAALIGKKGVVFGSPWFWRLPGVHVFTELPPYEKFVKLPGSSVDELKAAVSATVPGFNLPGTISVSQRTYMRQKFGDYVDELVRDEDTRRLVVETIVADFTQRSKRKN
ncbi:MAG: hypothetical protein RLZ72_370 [Actinomycetota bacterium]